MGVSGVFLKPLLSICTILSYLEKNPVSYPTNLFSQRPFVQCHINGLSNSVPFLFDTGAACSLLSLQIFRKLPLSNRPKKFPIKIKARSASGGVLKISGCYLFELTIQNKTVLHPIFVCKNLKSNILGHDFIKHHGLSYNAQTNMPYFTSPEKESTAVLAKSIYLPARSATMATIKVDSLGQQVLSINVPGCPQIYRNEVLIEACTVKKHKVYLANVSMVPQKLPRGTPIGSLELVDDSDLASWHQNDTLSVYETSPKIDPFEQSKFKKTGPVLTEERKKQIMKQVNLSHLPPGLRDKYLLLLMKYHYCISLHEFDVGRCSVARHAIPLIDESKAVYEKQFPLPINQRLELLRQVKNWIKLGLVSRVESEFCSSLFLVRKKTPEGAPPKYRIVQNFKKLNSVTKPSSFRLNRIDECLDRIALKGSKIFSNIDMRHGYYNLEIKPEDREKTAFWVEGLGQLAWNVAAQGLVNCPASFSRVVHRIFRKQIEKNEVENYLDDLLCHGKTHADLLRILEECFESLGNSGLKMNLEKCTFGANSLVYLGFRIDGNGYCASPDNVKTITNAKEPKTLKMVRSFCGLLNFYFNCVPNYSSLIKPLTFLTTKKSNWHGGDLPPEAKLAYHKIKKTHG